MPARTRTKLAAYRRRLKRHGIVRVEINVRKGDAALVRGIAKALKDPDRRAEVRHLLGEHLGIGKIKGLKGLLAAAPLEGVDLTREQDFGHDVIF